MKNKDILAMEKAKIVEKMNQAIKDDDAKMFSEAFTELCQKIEENVLEQAREMMNEQDVTILAQRGVRQLTSKEREYYEKVIEAMTRSRHSMMLRWLCRRQSSTLYLMSCPPTIRCSPGYLRQPSQD